ncbi:YbaN family protein [candidate division KSB1 bacterium]|nr:YbaN family protein [candidate division KSB1 bacterium]RQW10432.1 MAG: DUF454 domain-containing protein [candidate division KSB1 bacterium]
MITISVKRWILILSGSLALSLGLLGIFLPLLPTTPFVLIAAACYARSSRRLYVWLLQHKWFGPYIRNWREHKAIPRRSKIIILLLLWSTLSLTAFWAVDILVVRLILLFIGLGVTCFILTAKTMTDATRTEHG